MSKARSDYEGLAEVSRRQRAAREKQEDTQERLIAAVEEATTAFANFCNAWAAVAERMTDILDKEVDDGDCEEGGEEV